MKLVLLHHGLIEAVQAHLAAQTGSAPGLKAPGGLDLIHDRAEVLSQSLATDVASLAACYGYALAHDRPFLSQNRATALVAIELVLGLNGYALRADDTACFLGIHVAGQDELGAEAFAGWIRRHADAQSRRAA